MSEIFESSTRDRGDLAGVFEFDGETGYFYLCNVAAAGEVSILGHIHIWSGHTDLTALDVIVRWDDESSRVGLFLRGQLWAVFNSETSRGFGGGYLPGKAPEIPASESFGRRVH